MRMSNTYIIKYVLKEGMRMSSMKHYFHIKDDNDKSVYICTKISNLSKYTFKSPKQEKNHPFTKPMIFVSSFS